MLSFFIFSSGLQASYLFNVERQEAHLWIKHAGTVEIWYYIHFKNKTSGQKIDIVDVGLPFRNYDLSSAEASVDGKKLYVIRKSEYIPIGVELHLGSHRL